MSLYGIYKSALPSLTDGQQSQLEVDATGRLLASTLTDPSSTYLAADGSRPIVSTSIKTLFSDDFGGTAVDTNNNWDVLDGGLTVGSLINGQTSTVAIGSGVTGMTDGVTSSALTVSMGTNSNAERWYLSKQVFAGKEDILVLLSRSQALAANSCFVGLVEVDPVTQIPLLNANLATEFTNRGGCEFGLTTVTTAYQAEAIGDSSGAKATGGVGVAVALTTTQEYLIEIDSRDIIVSSMTVDSTVAKASGASRVSSQCPNDKKVYKLLMRFRNVGAPASTTTFVIQRVLVVDNYEVRVQLSTGEGDSIGNKAVAVNVANSPNVTVSIASQANAMSRHKLISAASSINATVVRATAGRIVGGQVANMAASARFLKLYNKATTPVVASDVPVYTIVLFPNVPVNLSEALASLGDQFSTGISYVITGGLVDTDTTTTSANDVMLNMAYF